MSFKTVELVLAAAVAQDETIAFAFPEGTEAGDYVGGWRHKMLAAGGEFANPDGITVAFTTVVTITYKGATTLPAGTKIVAQLDMPGADNGDPHSPLPDGVSEGRFLRVNLGTPVEADANGYVESQDLTALGVFSVDATAAAAIAAAALAGVADVPRNVVADWTGTAVLTVTGTDADGNVMVESSPSGTSMAGKKAFKTVTGISVSADVTGLTVGTGDVLGLPIFVSAADIVLAELEDGVPDKSNLGTLVPGDAAAPTATTGDVRGTYDPSGSVATVHYGVLMFATDPGNPGQTNYAG